MFKPVRGPKEGRSPPGLLYSGPAHGSRGKFSHRQVTIVLIVAVCILMGYFVLNSETGTVSSSPTTVIPKPGSGGLGDALLNENARPPPADTNVQEVHAELPPTEEKPKHKIPEDVPPSKPIKEQDYKPVREPLEDIYQRPASQPSVEKVKQEKEDARIEVEETESKSVNSKGWKTTHHDKLQHADKARPAPAREIWSDRPQFEKALSNVILRLPDEVHMRELIRPIEVSGKERMREIGLRTRAYKMYFDAWEALHMTVDSEGATYIRDDVIQYLRSRQDTIQGEEYLDEGVDGMSLAQTIRSYEAFRVFLLKFANLLFPWTAPYFSDHMSLHASIKKGGRGIVLTVGDDQAPYLLTTIYTYRRLGCTLPIEVMYLGDQDLGEDYRMELESLPGVTTRDIAQMTDDKGWRLAGWAAKPFAILLSSFREVIFIDADSLFFRNPEILFDDPDYKKHGALFFRDRLIMPESKKRWLQQVLPKPIPKLAKQSRFWTGESGHMQESGVIAVDKWKHFIALLLITRLNGPDRDGNKEKGIVGVYDMMYGDKETFWIGFLLAGDEDYAFHQGDAGIMGELEDKDKKKELKKKAKRDVPALEPEKKDVKQEEKKDEKKMEEKKDEKKPEEKKDEKKPEEKKDEKKPEEKKVEEKKEEKKDEKEEKKEEKKDEKKEEKNDEKKEEKNDEKKEEQKDVKKDDKKQPNQAELGFPKDGAGHHEEILGEIEQKPENYTICAPQLLHLDLEGRPLWFNGWLLKNKFADKTKKQFANFEYYLKEPRDIREPGAWQLAQSNMCCLTTDHDKRYEFTREEKETMQMIMERAHEMGMGDQH